MNTPREGGPSYAAPAVDKAFEIIDLLSREVAPLSVTDMAGRLGRSASQIYRVVQALHRLGMLVRDEEDDRYSLSLRLFEVATRHPPQARLMFQARPILGQLAEESDQSCHLAVITGTSVVILAQEDSPMAMHYTVKVGSRFPAMETSSGNVIAAYLGPTEQELLLADVPEDERAEHRERFGRIVANGHERRGSDVTAGVINLSAPVLDPAGRPLAAITIPFLPQRRMRRSADEVLQMVIAAAEKLSQLMRVA